MRPRMRNASQNGPCARNGVMAIVVTVWPGSISCDFFNTLVLRTIHKPTVFAVRILLTKYLRLATNHTRA